MRGKSTSSWISAFVFIVAGLIQIAQAVVTVMAWADFSQVPFTERLSYGALPALAAIIMFVGAGLVLVLPPLQRRVHIALFYGVFWGIIFMLLSPQLFLCCYQQNYIFTWSWGFWGENNWMMPLPGIIGGAVGILAGIMTVFDRKGSQPVEAAQVTQSVGA